MRRVDVVALVFGVLLTAVACGALWLAFAGFINWEVVRILAPLLLVVVGVAGLALSRQREPSE